MAEIGYMIGMYVVARLLNQLHETFPEHRGLGWLGFIVAIAAIITAVVGMVAMPRSVAELGAMLQSR